MIKKGFDATLDRFREISREGKKWIADLETKERMRTGISSLKVRYNRVFGYYIEVTKPNLPAVPSHYMRKQTLANAERFITQELQEYETQVLQAEEQTEALEYQLFLQVLKQVAAQVPRIQGIAQALAEIDVLSSLAEVAERYGYFRPQLNEGDTLIIVRGTASRSGADRPGGAFRSQRPLAERRGPANPDHHRPEHGREIDDHAAGGLDRHHGPDRKLCPGQRSQPEPGGPDLYPGGGHRRFSPREGAPSWWRWRRWLTS